MIFVQIRDTIERADLVLDAARTGTKWWVTSFLLFSI